MPTLEEIKARQQVMWSSGDYGKVAWVTVPLADTLCDAVEIKPGSTVLDVATGTGHVALAAARRFCVTTGIDYVPSLLEVARKRAASEQLEVDFREGDAENLSFEGNSFDYVLSAIGAMFAPDQEKTASELIRVCKPGGTIGMINWTSTGYVGELFKTIGMHVPPPAGLKPAAVWGSEDRVRELFGDAVATLTFKQGSLRQSYLSPEHYADFFLENFGPAVKASETLGEPARAAFAADLADLARRFNKYGDQGCAMDSDYTVVTATKR